MWNGLSWIWSGDHPFWRVCWWVTGGVDAVNTDREGGIFIPFSVACDWKEDWRKKANNEKEMKSGWIFLCSKHRTSWTALFGFWKENTAYLTVLACKRTNKVFKHSIATIYYLFFKVIEPLLPENRILRGFVWVIDWVQVVFSDFQHKPGHFFARK